MSHPHAHASRAVSENPGWSLLRMSASSRVGLALVIIGALWLATLAVIL
jgi:hypothetical protein